MAVGTNATRLLNPINFFVTLAILLTIGGAFSTIIHKLSENKASAPRDTAERIAEIEIPFIKNIGQLERQTAFYATLGNGTASVKNDGTILYNFSIPAKGGFAIEEKITTAKRILPFPGEKSETQINYFVGKEENWRTNIPSYKSITFGEILPGITLDLRAYASTVEKIFTVYPGSDPSTIMISVNGADKLTVTADGQFEMETSKGTVRMTAPIAYQLIDDNKKSVEISYVLIDDHTYGFKTGDFDRSLPLIIDPVVASTLYGGSDTETYGGLTPDLATDSLGNIFIAGMTLSSNTPTTTGTYDESHNGQYDGYIAKFNSSLTSLQAATFLGGSGTGVSQDGWDSIMSIKIDASNNVFVTGWTLSTDFPTTAGAYDTTFQIATGLSDIFVSKLNNNLSTLTASTALGGANAERSRDMAIMPSDGTILISGFTKSTDFPTTAGVFDSTLSGTNGMDAFVSKLSSDLSTLSASTYIGNSTPYSESSNEAANGVTGTSGGYIYAYGQTNETDFPTTTGAYDTTWNGEVDDFICRFDSNLASTGAICTYLGGNASEMTSGGIDIGTSLVFVTGATASSNFPTTTGAYSENLNGGQDIFVAGLSLDLSTLNASTYYGGSSANSAWNGEFSVDLTLDTTGNYIYVTGMSESTDTPTTSGAYDRTLNGTNDSIIFKMPVNLTSLTAATHIGGCNNDRIGTLVEESGGSNIYFTGYTLSSDFPTTSGAYDRTLSGTTDAFVAKIDSGLSAGVPGSVKDLAGTPGSYSVSLDWCAPPGDATSYIVEYGTTAGGIFDQTCTTSTCTDSTPGAVINDLNIEEYQFRITGSNTTGSGEVSNIATATPDNPCAGLASNQFCATQQISNYILTFTDIPDSFNFGTIISGTTSNHCNNTSTLPSPSDLCSNSAVPDPPGADDLLTVNDERDSGGFIVQLTTQGTFTDGTNTIPLDNLYVITSIDETDPNKADGINYGADFTGSKTVTAPLYVNETSDDISDPATYTSGWSYQSDPYTTLRISQFGGYPIDLMNGTLPSTSGRVGEMSLYTNFNLTIDYDQLPGDYSLILTYDLTDSTT